MQPIGVIQSLTTWTAPLRNHDSCQGPEIKEAYRHLLADAGRVSMPPDIATHSTNLLAAYAAPTADETHRCSQLLSDAVGVLLEQQPSIKSDILNVFVTQCTLDQQILSSTCLRVCHEHVPGARIARTFGQMGTAGIATLMQLAMNEPSLGKSSKNLTCLVAGDKWLSPFYRHIPDLVTYADCAAASLFGPPGTAAIADIEAISTSVSGFDERLWKSPVEEQQSFLLNNIKGCISEVATDEPGLLLIGDNYHPKIRSLASILTGIPELSPLTLQGNRSNGFHYSSASLFFSLDAALRESKRQNTPLRIVAWTASQSGHAGAIRALCYPSAALSGTTWMPNTNSTV